MLLRKLSFIYSELYGKHEEFVEVDMTIEKLVEASWDDTWDKSLEKAVDEAVGEAVDKAVGEEIMRYTGFSRREIMVL